MTTVPAPPPFNPEDATPILPVHMSDTISAIAKLHADHERAASPMQRLIEKTTDWLGKPRFLGQFTIFVAAWLSTVGLQMKFYGRSFDPPPFNLLQGILTVLAVYITALILSTQRRAGQLASHREQLTLELATLAEQKSAKTIALLEEMRRDNPLLPDREDKDAEAMAETADPEAVLQAIIQTQQELKEQLAKDLCAGASPGLPEDLTAAPKLRNRRSGTRTTP